MIKYNEREIQEINWHLNNVNETKDIYSFIDTSSETTKEETERTIQDLFEIIRACQDAIESIVIGIKL